MASLIANLVRRYEEHLPYADPRTKNWPLAESSPVYVWVLSVTYLLFVWLGPKYMRNKKPIDLQAFLVIYNLGLVVLSVYMVVEIFLSTWDAEYKYTSCAPYNSQTILDPKEMRIAKVLWWYFVSKAIELMDTVSMILRKKDSQVTFLHVFHHVTILNSAWWVMVFIPGGLTFFGPMINSSVHVVMYAYYGLAAIPSMRDKLWWKKYITKIQLIQFVITLTHNLYFLWIVPCDFPTWGLQLNIFISITMFVLFSNFYFRAYSAKKRVTKGDLNHNNVVHNKTE